jgi:transcriptional regulator NrdR family protein
MTSVVGKTTEDYNRERLARAVKRAATANRTPVGDAENFVRHVVERVERWLANKTEITGHELRLQTAAALTDYDADAAYFYENEKRII